MPRASTTASPTSPPWARWPSPTPTWSSRAGAPLSTPDPATFYDGGTAGYTDYPAYAA
ncbi:hypothetical protein [Streptomyces stelliscabiei]|uniref:hypothetical protein n=1 Tax=Streptomyces stelliscabiei TaxID=146820 RepID=UPI002FF1F00E